MSNEVFYVVIAAVAVLDERITQLNPATSFPRKEWVNFTNALEWIQKVPESSEIKIVSETFNAFCKLLPFGDIEVDMTQ